MMANFTRRQFAWTIISSLNIRSLHALEVGEPFPHFAAKTIDGERITTESLKGQIVLIEFWATWCGPCKSDEAAVESMQLEFGKNGLVVLAVNMGEPKRKVRKYLDSAPRISKVVLAEDTTLAAICNANAYPIYNVIDREGKLVGVQRAPVENAHCVAC